MKMEAKQLTNGVDDIDITEVETNHYATGEVIIEKNEHSGKATVDVEEIYEGSTKVGSQNVI